MLTSARIRVPQCTRSTDGLRIRNLLDDPMLRAVMGVDRLEPIRSVELGDRRPPNIRRLLDQAAA